MSAEFLSGLLSNDDWTDLEENAEFHAPKVAGVKELIRLDLDSRFSALSVDRKKDAIIEAAFSNLPEKMRAFEKTLKGELRMRKIQADYFILCIIPVELAATLMAFGLSPDKSPDHVFLGHRLFKVELAAKDGTAITVWIGGVGEARNVECAAFVASMYAQVFNFKKAILVGIAGGNREQGVSLCDVISADTVLDLEGGKTETPPLFKRLLGHKSSNQMRIRTVKCEGHLANSLRTYRFDEEALRTEGRSIVEASTSGSISFSPNDFGAKYEFAWIQCGEKVQKDGSLPRNSKIHHDKLLAVEMEGSGFSLMCKTLGIDWLIFRGVSDFGDRKKGDKVHANAALMAALYAKKFIAELG